MTGYCDRICRVNGVLGASILDREGLILDDSYPSPSAKNTLEDTIAMIVRVIQFYEITDPDIENLRVRFKESTLYTKIYRHAFVVTLCKNDLMLYLLDSMIDALFNGQDKPKALVNEPMAMVPARISQQTTTVTDHAATIYEPVLMPGGAVEMSRVRPVKSWSAEEAYPMAAQQNIVKYETAPATSVLFNKILSMMTPYFTNAGSAERLLQRQIRERLKINIDQLNLTHLEQLAEWVTTAAGLLIDKGRAAELGQKIRRLR